MSLTDTLKLFMARYKITAQEIPNYACMYHMIDNQGNISDYLITMQEVRPGIWEEV